MFRSAALASMVEASTPMRSPLISPASAISTRTQLKTAAWTSWGRRVRLRDSQEWSATRSRLPSRRNARSGKRVRAAPLQTALAVDALEVAH